MAGGRGCAAEPAEPAGIALAERQRAGPSRTVPMPGLTGLGSVVPPVRGAGRGSPDQGDRARRAHPPTLVRAAVGSEPARLSKWMKETERGVFPRRARAPTAAALEKWHGSVCTRAASERARERMCAPRGTPVAIYPRIPPAPLPAHATQSALASARRHTDLASVKQRSWSWRTLASSTETPRNVTMVSMLAARASLKAATKPTTGRATTI